MRRHLDTFCGLVSVFFGLLSLHYPLLHLPYFWDEAGYYIPAALDFYRSWLLVPQSTLPTGHTPLVMVYLALAWRVFGFSPLVTRAAMILVAAGTVVAVHALARRVASREAAIWSALLLALSPMFFAQSSLVYLDLPVALFTTLAVLALLEGQMVMFAVTASLAVLAKETAVVLLPVAWVFAWKRPRAQQAAPLRKMWLTLTVPLVPLAAWALYYHQVTGFWTGNAEYLQYNLYSTLSPGRIFWSLLRRLYEVFLGGFNWLLVGGAALGVWSGRAKEANGDREAQRTAAVAPQEGSEKPQRPQEHAAEKVRVFRDFLCLAGGTGAAYVLMLSVVGGAILPRYLLPIFPALFLALVALVCRLPKVLARSLCAATLACFVGAWFINPSYPFPYEDNLAYRDFIHLHQQAAQLLEGRPPGERILTAWPATDELARPFLGYVRRPLRVVPLQGFNAQDFADVSDDSFDVLYLYPRKWEPPNNWLAWFPSLQRVQEHYFDYAPQIGADALAARYGLRPLARFEQRGQWAKIFGKESEARSQKSE